MDLKGVNNKINNIHAGTQHYKPQNADAMYFGNWVDSNLIELYNRHKTNVLCKPPFNNFTDDSLRKNLKTLKL